MLKNSGFLMFAILKDSKKLLVIFLIITLVVLIFSFMEKKKFSEDKKISIKQNIVLSKERESKIVSYIQFLEKFPDYLRKREIENLYINEDINDDEKDLLLSVLKHLNYNGMASDDTIKSLDAKGDTTVANILGILNKSKLGKDFGDISSKEDINVSNSIEDVPQDSEIMLKEYENSYNNKSKNASYFNNLGKILYKIGNYDKSLDSYNKLLEILETKEKTLEFVKASNNIGIIYNIKGQKRTALEYYKKSLDVAKKIELIKTPKYMANLYNNIANIYNTPTSSDKALNYYNKSLNIFNNDTKDNNIEISAIYNNLAIVYLNKKKYNEALTYSLKSLKIKKQRKKEYIDIANTYNNIGIVNFYQKNFSKSISSYKKAVELREKILGKDNNNLASSYYNIGVLYLAKGDKRKSISYLNKALDAFEESLGGSHPYSRKAQNTLKKNNI